jgi:cellobiose-specific phosphotransferase system component IIA
MSGQKSLQKAQNGAFAEWKKTVDGVSKSFLEAHQPKMQKNIKM